MKKMLAFAAGMMLAVSASAVEQEIWTAGAFADQDGKTSSSSAIVRQTSGDALYAYAFKNEKSNQVYGQFPVFTKDNFSKLKLSLHADSGTFNIEVWLEGNGWKFQKKIKLEGGEKFQDFTINIKELKSPEAKYLRLVIPNKNNPKAGTIDLKKPVWLK